MPIKPENRGKYPADWNLVRLAILKRAGDRCELCFLENGDAIQREPCGKPFRWTEIPPAHRKKAVKVVLTIAHINQDPTDNRPVNLLALCQRCHNRIDLPYRTLNAAATRAAKEASFVE